jgi:hypothetical protein
MVHIQAAKAMLNFLSRNGTMRGEKATAKTSLMSHMSVGGAIRILLRFFQFVMGIVVIGLYAQDIHNVRKAGAKVDSKWSYAVFCGSISSLTALIFMVPLIKSWVFFYVDALIWFFWVVLFGIFGKEFLNQDPKGDSGVVRMKRAAWIDMVNMILWFISACYGGWAFWRYRKERTTHTGRAENFA